MATKPTITIKFRQPGSGTTLTFTANVVTGCNWSYGRQRITDTFQGHNCQVFGIKPANVTTWPEIGAAVSVVVTDSATSQTAQFCGSLADVEIQYGTIAALDTFTMLIESPLSRAGRQIGSITTVANDSTYYMADKINALTPMDIGVGFLMPYQYAFTTSAQTIEQTVTDHVNLWAATEQGRVLEFGDATDPDLATLGATLVGTRLGPSTGAFYFGDSNPSHSKYSQLVFQSLADNYSTKVLVNATGFAEQSSGTGSFNYEISTINGSATEAANLAGYVKTSLDVNQRTPTSIRFDGATNGTVITLGNQGNNNAAGKIDFRGTTYDVGIEGANFSANATNWECELFLSSNAYRPWLILGSATYGILDTNRLGL